MSGKPDMDPAKHSLLLRALSTTTLFAMAGVLMTACVASALLSRFWAVTALRDPPDIVMRAARACHTGAPPQHPVQAGQRSISFYHPVTFAPVTPGDPELPQTVKTALQKSPRMYVKTGLPFGDNTLAAGIKRLSSPCGLLVVRVAESPLHREQVQAIIFAAAALISALSGLGSYFLTARPLLRRVAEASAAATKVGDADFASPDQRGWQDLGLIHRALADADRRIKDNTTLLRARAEEIESLLSSIAHDLKTPLTVIQLHLQRATREQDAAECRQSLSKALVETQYAAALLENLETGAQLRAGMANETAATTDLCEIVVQTVTRFEVLGAHLGIEVAGAWPDGPVPVRADPVLCTRILANLVHNALRHSGGRHVAVVLSEVSDGVSLEIHDDGVGFSPDQLTKLRECVDSDQSATHARRGLAIVRALCVTQGFTLAFTNAEDGGAVVSLRIARGA